MSIDIGSALREGLDRTLARNGAVLFVMFLVVGVVSKVMIQSATKTLLPRYIQLVQDLPQQPSTPELIQSLKALSGATPLAVPIPLWGVIALFLVVFVVGQAVRVISDRTFISDEEQTLSEPDRRIGWATLSSIGGFIVINALIFLVFVPTGLLLAVSPLLASLWALIAIVVTIGLVVSFFFFRQSIAVEDTGPIDALADSWSLVSESRLGVFGLGATLFGINYAITVAGSSVFGLFGRISGVIAGLVAGAVLLTFDSAVAAQAYRQLREAEQSVDVGEEDAEDEWEPDEKWNDPPLS